MNEKLIEIAEAIEALGKQSIFYDVMTTLPAAILAAAAAVAAAGATVYFQNRSIKINVSKAIRLEVSAIAKEIDRRLALPGRNADIECEVVRMRSNGIPVFTSNSQNVPLLKQDLAEAIFEFYSMFLTIPINHDTNTFIRQDLETLASKSLSIIKGNN